MDRRKFLKALVAAPFVGVCGPLPGPTLDICIDGGSKIIQPTTMVWALDKATKELYVQRLAKEIYSIPPFIEMLRAKKP